MRALVVKGGERVRLLKQRIEIIIVHMECVSCLLLL